MRSDRVPLVVLVGDRDVSAHAHDRIEQALPALGVDYRWHGTETITEAADLAGADGVWVVPGSPYRSMAGALTAIRHARETGLPYLGTCGGFQHALIEWARNVLGLADAQDIQSAPQATLPLITALACSLLGERRPLRLVPGSALAALYGRLDSEEVYHCRYGLNPDFAGLFTDGALRITALDDQGAPRAVELAGHPFFIGTLYQPELASDRHQQHLLMHAFVRAVQIRHGSEPAGARAGYQGTAG